MNNHSLFNMLFVAYRMLIHSRKKCVGMVMGATLSTFMVMQQPAIYQGISDRIVAPIKLLNDFDLWVMHFYVESFENPPLLNGMERYRIQSVPGVQQAIPLYKKGQRYLHEKTGQYYDWELMGVDPETLTGLPIDLLSGHRDAIRQPNAVIIDGYSVKQLETPDKKTIEMGDKLVDSDGREWIVAGVTKPLRTYSTNPKLYVASNHLKDLENTRNFILVKVQEGFDKQWVAQRIKESWLGYEVLTSDEFIQRSLSFFKKKTPILIIFICIALFGYLIGLLVMGQIFTNFIHTHAHQYGMLKMLGLSNHMLVYMVLFQASFVGLIGFILALFLNVFFGALALNTVIAYRLTAEIVCLGLLGTLWVIGIATFFSTLRLMKQDSVELCRDAN